MTQTLSLATQIVDFASRWAADLKQSANGLASPIYSLPGELPRIIIQRAMCGLNKDDHYANLHRLRSVSVWWCQTIDTMPNLWTIILTKMTKHAVKRSAQRSQNLPLSIDFEWDFDFDLEPGDISVLDIPLSPILDDLHSLQARWGSLSVRTRNKESVEQFLSATFTTLTSLTLSAPDGNEDFHLGTSLQGLVADSPDLQHIDISDRAFQWHTIFTTNIHSITLSHIHDTWDDAPTLQDLSNMLSCCPELIFLSMKDNIFRGPQISSSLMSEHSVNLPSLQILELTLDWGTPIILNTILFPKNTRISIDCEGAYERERYWEAFGQWMTKVSGGWRCPDAIKVVESWEVEEGLTISVGDGHFVVSNLKIEIGELFTFLSWIDTRTRAATTGAELDFTYLPRLKEEDLTRLDSLNRPKRFSMRYCPASQRTKTQARNGGFRRWNASRLMD